jgi:hypothetical protein
MGLLSSGDNTASDGKLRFLACQGSEPLQESLEAERTVEHWFKQGQVRRTPNLLSDFA